MLGRETRERKRELLDICESEGLFDRMNKYEKNAGVTGI